MSEIFKWDLIDLIDLKWDFRTVDVGLVGVIIIIFFFEKDSQHSPSLGKRADLERSTCGSGISFVVSATDKS